MKYEKVVIIGMGLIGGSLGKALLEKGLAEEVVGVFRRQSSLDRATRERSLTAGFVNEYDKAVPGADVVIIGTPVHTVKEVLDGLAEVLTDGKTLVTDVGSTKKEIVEYAARFKDKFAFVGGHPLAGSEKAGVEYSNPGLFEGSVCVLTPDKNSCERAVDSFKDFWQAVGAAIVVLDPEEHDENLAISSHLPHIVAYALAGVLEKSFPKTMLATGFKDTTRIASSDSGLWSDIFLSNRDNVLKAIARYREVLSDIEKDIDSGNEESLKGKLKSYKAIRDELS